MRVLELPSIIFLTLLVEAAKNILKHSKEVGWTIDFSCLQNAGATGNDITIIFAKYNLPKGMSFKIKVNTCSRL